ncbi:ABC transporter ATP-binding protein/permease [Lacrimispora sp. NSJ-141]|uniref:ABC transporter ATP-binding protein/permease n=1 Tax=Lientehia hominis TaxID=2897778 RepID=A0AAP2RI85_9FIRM|nr:ABC transporter ATP-binding protein [Lientehia hominis]MCD2491348.1 ABC transporter ATP-binding protein/permease [Lientehia hominis]
MEKKKSPLKLLLEWVGREKYWMYLSILLSLISGLCTMIPYYGIYRLMEAVYNNTFTTEFVMKDAALIFGSILIRFILFGASGVASHKGAYRALYKVRCMVVDHMAKVPLGALNERSTGEIKTVLNEDIEKLELFLAHNMPELVCYLVGPIVVFIYLLTVNVPLALISLIPLVLALAVMGCMFAGASGMMGRANKSVANLNSVMVEYISGMKLIKAYNMGSKSFQKFSAAVQEENSVWNQMSKKMGPFYAAFIVVIECGMLLMIPLGGMFFLKGSITASIFLLFAFVGSMYLTEIRPLQELGSSFAQVLAGVTKTEEILNISTFEGGTDFPDKHDIELRNVRFSYDGKTDVLEHCNLKVDDGERMALVGRSGAGKSTVIELISRFYDVQEGEVLIGGKNVKDINYETLLQNVAIVFQKTFLTRDSVIENIRMGTNATLKEVRAAAKEAQIDNFIMSLPNGYDTKVGSFSSRFSGGEKQRIAIARAILKNAPILILDEATSAADPENQVEIDKAIENLCKGKTVIIVAHRLSALKMCHRIAVVEHHTITSVGFHEKVRKENDYYNHAWTDYETARNMSYQLEGGTKNA